MKYSGIIAHWSHEARTDHYLPCYTTNSVFLGLTPGVTGLSYAKAHEASTHIVLDGYLQNRRELIEKWHLSKESDSAAIALSGYLAEGEEFLTCLKGPFSLVIFEQKSAKFVLARDALGQRPLFFFAKDSELIIASCIAQIHKLKTESLSINYGYLAENILDSTQSPEQTCWNEIHRLPPATFAVWTNNSIRKTRYWTPNTSIASDLSFDDAAAWFADTLGSVVASSPYPEKETAVSFSGGLDSSAIAASASKTVAPTLISMLFEDGPASEANYIESVQKQLSLPISFVYPKIPQKSWMRDQVALSYDLPTDPNGWLTGQIRAFAKAHGFSLIYSGYGGDEILTGKIFQKPSIVNQALLWTKSSLESIPAWQSVLEFSKRKFSKLRWYPLWCNPAFFKDTGIEERFRQNQIGLEGASAYQEYVWQLISGPHNAQLRDREQRESMADDVVQQYPFFAQQIVEFALQLPVSFFTDGNRQKLLLRRAFSNQLPKMLLERDTKAEFSHVSIECLNVHLETTPSLSELSNLGWFDIPSLKKQFSLLKAPSAAASQERTCSYNQLWKILAIEEFLSKH